jgi:predicted transposase YbfD/YdcC
MDYSTLALRLEGGDEGFVVSLNSLYARWCGLTDARKAKGKRYPLALVLVGLVVAKLAGADKPQAIAEWVAERAALFVESFELRLPTMPSHHTYRRVMRQVIVVSELAQTAQAYLAELPQTGVPVQICLDGKTLRGTIAGGDNRGLHLLAAYWPGTGLVLCQVAVDPSTNEIGAAPLVLKALDLQGKIVTGDAMFAQRELSLLIGQAGGDYVWTIKDNQPRLRADIEKLFEPDTSVIKGFSAGPTDYQSAQTINKGHGRIETRRLTVTSQLQETSDWPYLAQVFRLERATELVASGTQRGEIVYGMTSLTAQQASPARLQALVRRHWSVENELHYRRDVTFQEDATRLKAWNAAQILAIINNLVLALLVHIGPGTVPQARRHYAAHPDEALRLVLTAPGLS